MNTAELLILRAFVLASQVPAIIAARNSRADADLANLLNAKGTFVVYRSNVTQDEIMQNGFDWVRVDNLSVGKARIWEWLFDNQANAIDPRKPNVRAGIAECWSGATNSGMRDAINLHLTRTLTLAEQAFATGTGTVVSPGSVSWEGAVTASDIGQMYSAV